MTFKEIFFNEDNNRKFIYLHLEGQFLRAHNQSAYLLCREVPGLKVSRRIIKKENREDFTVGFPFAYRNKWLYKFVVDEVAGSGGKLFMARVDRELSETEYRNWCDAVVAVDACKKVVSRVTKVIEKQPVFKTAYDMLMEVLGVCANADRRYVSVSDRLRGNAMELVESLLFFYEREDRPSEALRLQRLCRVIDFELYVLQEKKSCPPKAYSENAERLASVRSQLDVLSKRSSGEKKKNVAVDAAPGLDSLSALSE